MKSLPLSGIPGSLLSKDEFVHNKDEEGGCSMFII